MRTITLSEAFRMRRLEEGEVIKYHPNHKRFILKESMTGFKENQVFETEELPWRIFQFKNYFMLVADEVTRGKLLLNGKTGYERGSSALHIACMELYSCRELCASAQSMTRPVYDLLPERYKRVQSRREHWIATRNAHDFSGYESFTVNVAKKIGADAILGETILYYSYGVENFGEFSFRPVVFLTQKTGFDSMSEELVSLT